MLGDTVPTARVGTPVQISDQVNVSWLDDQCTGADSQLSTASATCVLAQHGYGHELIAAFRANGLDRAEDVIAATNKRLSEEIEAGRFREDLYYRLNVVQLTVPPLRERMGDIPALCRHLLARIAGQPGLRSLGLTDDALSLLMQHPWPGNVRQLQNALFRAAVLCEGDALTPQDFPQIAAQIRAGDMIDRVTPPDCTVICPNANCAVVITRGAGAPCARRKTPVEGVAEFGQARRAARCGLGQAAQRPHKAASRHRRPVAFRRWRRRGPLEVGAHYCASRS